MEHRGGCFCNAVRYKVSGKPRSVTNCHCADCRRVSGAPFVTWATFDADKFQIVKGDPTRLASSARAARAFCGACGTPLTFQAHETPHEIDVTVGSMDHPNNFPPDDHTWTSSQVSWLRLGDDLPRHPRHRA